MSRIVIIGGSNTLLRGGWRPHFEALVADGIQVDNLSVGGTTSAMGAFRLLTQGNLQKGDIVLWEYALNEHGHFRHGHKLHVLMSHVEWLIRVISDAGARLMPIIMTTKAQEQAEGLDTYRAHLHYLFRNHDIDFLDVSFDMRRHYGLSKLPSSMFQDNFHYQPDGQVVKDIAAMIHARLDAVRVTICQPDRLLFTADNRKISAITEFNGVKPALFKTAIISAPCFSFDQPLVTRFRGRLLAAAIVGSPGGKGFRLTVGDEHVATFSTRRAYEQKGPRRIVKQLSFHALFEKPFACGNKPIELTRPENYEDMLVDHTYEAGPPDADEVADDGLLGLLIDQPNNPPMV